MKIAFPSRYALLIGFILLFIGLSFVLRVVFLIWNFSEIDHGIVSLFITFFTGLFYDIGTVTFFASVALIPPKKRFSLLLGAHRLYLFR